MAMINEGITVSRDGVVRVYAGQDAAHLFRVRTLMSSLKLYHNTGLMPTRGVTVTRMLTMAGEYTGKKYKRGAVLEAVADLKVWADNMLAALPVTVE